MEDSVEQCVWVYVHGWRTGNFRLWWVGTRWLWQRRGDIKTLWEDGDLAGGKEKNLNGFGVPGWSRSLTTDHEEERGRILETAPLVLGAGVMKSSGGKAKRPGVFLEVLRKSWRLREVDMRSRDKVDKVECRCRLAPWRRGRRSGRKKWSQPEALY